MPTPKEEQVAWIRAVERYLGVSTTELARRAKLAPSTLQRPLNDKGWTGMVSGKTLAAVADAAGLRPLEFPNPTIGLNEPEAVPFVYDERADAIASNFDRAIRELVRGRNGRDAWVMHSYALELAGVLPGDVLIVDMNLTARPKDIVCAQLYQWSAMKADTVFRIYEPPYLMTSSMRYGTQKPVPVDDQDAVIKGVVDGIFRRRRHAAAA